MRSFAFAALLVAACQSTAPPINRVTCGDVFNASTSEASLIQRFGAANVQSKTVELGEGETAPGTVVNGLEIVWKDPAARRNPRYVRIPSSSNAETYEGIRIGTDLKTLEKINGAPFTLAGFNWDYAGTVFSWGSGRLSQIPCKLLLRLEPPRSADQGAASRLVGDREFSSSSADMQFVNPRVYEILLMFD